MTTKISEAKFEALKSKLRELFELDKSDLDFGIYRIMAAKNKEITAFLDRHLKESVGEVLGARGSDESTKLASEISKAREAAATAGFNPDDSPRVKELEEQYAKLGGGSTEELEADIYNHLLNFFSRYYDEGDFISKRFYKGDTYAIPYGGEEVALHWANKDQHYIKSGEWHKDYRFRVDGKLVHFRLVEASSEAGNNREPDESKRHYILSLDNPVSIENAMDTLILCFEFRSPTELDKKRVEQTEATRIFGGNYDKNSGRSKGEDREGYCADAQKRAIAALPQSWQDLLNKPEPTPSKPKRTLLGKYLDHFTARNSFDYFVHRDLRGFLGRELSSYIKNEVVHIDDFGLQPNDLYRSIQTKVVATRRVADKVIDFLSTIENFQRCLWLKRKFVLRTNWCCSVSLVPDELLPKVIANSVQVLEWKSLFRIELIKEDLNTIGFSEQLSLEFIKQNSNLTLNTANFDISFVDRLVSTFENVHALTKVVMVNSENAQASRLISNCHAGTIKAVYADPPYNTDASAIMYKNDYKNSSWLSYLSERVSATLPLLSQQGIFCLTIDDFEFHRARFALEQIFGKERILGVIAIKNNPSGRATGKGFAIAHEYAIFGSVNEDAEIGRLLHSQEQLERYNHRDSIGPFEWVNFRKHGGANANRWARRKLYYPIFVKGEQVRFPAMEWDDDGKDWVLREVPQAGEHIVYPTTPEGDEKTWKWGIETAVANPSEFTARLDSAGRPAVYRKARLNEEGTLPRTLWDKSEYSSTEYGTNLLRRIFGESEVFSFPKSVHAVADCLRVSNVGKGDWVADIFAGSATTAHAVFNLNSADGGNRGVILCEMGWYFDNVTLPRVRKCAYSTRWDDGVPQARDGGQILLKYFALESYEDALNNLPSPDGKLFEAMDQATRDSLITYSLDLELGPHLLNMDAFKDPWGYKIYAQPAGEDELSLHHVDMVETFNYLIGLKVQAYGPIERYSAEFVRLPHGDDKDSKGVPLSDDKREGRLRVEGRLRRDAEGPYVYQRVEGELNDGNATRVLVIWRKLTDDVEKDAAVLEAWMARHRETTKERSDYREYHLIYLNGPITLPQPTQELRTVLPTEQTFQDRMFEDN
jgi:adenine-specific DNA-methyltransferase